MAARQDESTKRARALSTPPGGTTMRFLLRTIAAALPATAATAAQADIKIGAVLSVTGPASFLGDPEKKTLEMYVAEINAKGGINGQQVKLFVYDDGAGRHQDRRGALGHRPGLVPRRSREEDAGDVCGRDQRQRRHQRPAGEAVRL